MNGIIIYKGKYGATAQYAQWLSEELGIRAVAAETISGERLKQYDFFILGSSVYIGKLLLAKWMKQNLAYLQDKKIFFFQVAATPAEQTQKRRAYNEKGLPGPLKKCNQYYLPGKCIITQLSWKDRFLLKMGARMTKDPAEKKQMLTSFDQLNREFLWEIIRNVNQHMTKNEEKPVKSPYSFLLQ